MRWVVALVAVAVAAGLRFALDPWLGAAHPFPLFLAAVIVAVWFGGIAPALIAGLAGYLVANYFFLVPRGLFAPRDAVEMAGLGVYVVSSALIIGLGGAMHAARRRAEASEERLRRFMENSPAAVFVKDDAGRYVYMNAAAQGVVGVPDWRGKTDDELLPPAAAREVHAHDAQMFENQTPAEFDLRIGERQFHSTKFPLRDAGGRLLIGAISMDVTEQARAAEELRRQREELRLVTDTMPAGVVCVSAELRYIWVNRIFASWIGRAPAEIIGRPVAEVLAERDWLDLRPHVERTLRGERVEYERKARFAAGERWIHSVMEPTRDEGGAPNGLVAVVSDICTSVTRWLR